MGDVMADLVWSLPDGEGTARWVEAGAESAWTLVGPVTVTFDDFGGSGGNFPLKICDLEPGQWVMDVAVLVTLAWDGTTPIIWPAIAPTSDLTNASDFGAPVQAQNVADGADPSYQLYSLVPAASVRIRPARCVTAASVIVYQTYADVATQGSADVYAWLYQGTG